MQGWSRLGRGANHGIFFLGTAAGILLGLRFNVFALVPTILIAIVGIVLIERELRVIIFTAVGTVVLLQFGYIGGCVLPAMLVHFGCTSDRQMNQRDQAETLKS